MSTNTPLKPYTFDRVVRILLGLALVVASIFLLNQLSSVLIPFFIALLLAYLLHPLMGFFQNRLRIKNRPLAVLLTLLSLFGLIAGTAWVLVPAIGKEATQMGVLLKAYATSNHWDQYIPDNIEETLRAYAARPEIQDFFTLENAGNVLRKALPGFWNVFSGSISFIMSIFGTFIILLYLFFILLDYEKISSGWKALIPNKYREQIVGLVSDLESGMNSYFRAQALIALIVGILFAIGFGIIGLPMGIALGLFIGLLNMVPYLQIIGFVPALFLALLKSLETGQNFWWLMAFVLLVFAVVQLIQEALLTPQIMGKVTGMHPAIILLSLSIWGSLLGILGMLIALPVTTLLISYYQRFILHQATEQ